MIKFYKYDNGVTIFYIAGRALKENKLIKYYAYIQHWPRSQDAQAFLLEKPEVAEVRQTFVEELESIDAITFKKNFIKIMFEVKRLKIYNHLNR